MKRLALSLLAVATVAGLASPAQAQNLFNWKNLSVFSHWNIDSTISNEQARINAGKSNGSLTPQESSRLQNRLNDIVNLKARLSGGGLSRSEQNAISNQLDQLSQDVYRESNDRQMLGSNPYGWSQSYKPNNTNWRYGHWDNGKWVSKNNWNQYSSWRNNNHWNWHDGEKWSDGQRGSGITASEQAQINAKRANLAHQEAAMRADGHLSRQERNQLRSQDKRLDRQENRDRRD